MQLLLPLISNKDISKDLLIRKLTQFPNKIKHDERALHRMNQIQQRISSQEVPRYSIHPQINESKFNSKTEYKKYLIRHYLKKNINDLCKNQKEQTDNVQCLNHIMTFLEHEHDLHNSEETMFNTLQYLDKMTHQYQQLMVKCKNNGLLKQLLIVYKKNEERMNRNLKNLVKKQGNKVITFKIKDIKQCISKVKDMSVFNHWMFAMFGDLVNFDGKQKQLVIFNLKIDDKRQSQTIILISIQPKSINFKKSTSQEVANFISTMNNTFKVIQYIHKQIKNKVFQLSNNEKNQKSKNIFKQTLGQITRLQSLFKDKIAQQFLPTIYLFSLEQREQIFKIIDINKKLNPQSMPYLLMNYKYSSDSKQTEANFNQIASNICSKLINSGDKQFQQVCFYLDVNTQVIKKKDGKNSLKGVDFAYNLVSILVNQCIDKIEYTKIQKLLKIQDSIRYFKAKIDN